MARHVCNVDAAWRFVASRMLTAHCYASARGRRLNAPHRAASASYPAAQWTDWSAGWAGEPPQPPGVQRTLSLRKTWLRAICVAQELQGWKKSLPELHYVGLEGLCDVMTCQGWSSAASALVGLHKFTPAATPLERAERNCIQTNATRTMLSGALAGHVVCSAGHGRIHCTCCLPHPSQAGRH